MPHTDEHAVGVQQICDGRAFRQELWVGKNLEVDTVGIRGEDASKARE